MSEVTYEMTVEYTNVVFKERSYDSYSRPRWVWRVTRTTPTPDNWRSNNQVVTVRGYSRFRRKALRKARKAYSNMQSGVVVTTDTADLLKRIQNLEHELGIEAK